jgi:hypothetical protein
MSIQVVKEFNDIVNSFLIQITPIIGSTYHANFELITKLNSLIVIEQFMVHALPVRDKILNKDESYFLDTPCDNTNIDNQPIISELLKMRSIYTQLDVASKATLWDITSAMLYLGEEYIRLNRDKFT